MEPLGFGAFQTIDVFAKCEISELSMEKLVGKSIGKYQIVLMVGNGHFTQVYRAIEAETGKVVALKLFRPSRKYPDEFIERFNSLCERIIHLAHPNIIPLLDYGLYDDRFYIVSEFVVGSTLTRKLHTSFTCRQTAQMLLPVAKALQYAHEQQIVHGDVKPENIFVSANGNVKIGDFAVNQLFLGEEIKSTNLTGIGFSRPNYHAPEQILQKGTDERTDIYSLGLVFLELCTGQPTFRSENELATAIDQVQRPILPARKGYRTIPRHLAPTLNKALEKGPDRRFQKMADFTDALFRISRGKRVNLRHYATRRKMSLVRVFLLSAAILVLVFFFQTEILVFLQRSPVLAGVDPTATAKSSPIAFASTPTDAMYAFATATALLKTPSAIETSSPTATSTATPFVLPLAETPIAKPVEAISEKNADQIALLARWGIGLVQDAAWSPDGTSQALATTTGVYLINPDTEQAKLWIDCGWTTAVAYSPNSQFLAIGTQVGSVELYDLLTGKRGQALGSHQDRVLAIAFSPDEKTIASSSADHTLMLWDMESNAGRLFARFYTAIDGFAFVDSETLITANMNQDNPDQTILTSWQIHNSEIVWTNRYTLKNVSDLEIEPDMDNPGAYWIGIANLSSNLYFINSLSITNQSNQLVGYGYPGHGDFSSLAFDPTTQLVTAVGQKGDVILFDHKTRDLLWSGPSGESNASSLPENERRSNFVAFSPAGESILVAGWDGSVWRADVLDGQALTPKARKSLIAWEVSFSPSNELLAMQTVDGTVQIWNIADGTPEKTITGNLADGYPFSPDGNWIALATDRTTVGVFDVRSGQKVWSLPGHDRIDLIQFSDDSLLLATGTPQQFKVWAMGSGQEILIQTMYPSGSCKTALTPGKTEIAFSSSIGVLDFVDSDLYGAVCQIFSMTATTATAFTTNGSRMAQGFINSLLVKPVKSIDGIRNTQVEYLQDRKGVVTALMYSPDQLTLLGGFRDGSIVLWNSNGDEIFSTPAQIMPVLSVAYSADHLFFASSSEDGTVQLWGLR